MTHARLDVRLLPRDSDDRSDVGLVRPWIGVVGLAVVVAAFVFSEQLQRWEAAAAVPLARWGGLDGVVRYGSTIVFVVDGRPTGVDITVGCSAAFLITPFVLAATALLAVRRIPFGRALRAVLVAVVVVLVVNQLRVFAIVAAMDAWGPETGYSRTHVLVGTALSTVGVVVAGSAFVAMVLKGSYPSPRWTGGDVHGEVP